MSIHDQNVKDAIEAAHDGVGFSPEIRESLKKPVTREELMAVVASIVSGDLRAIEKTMIDLLLEWKVK